MNGAWSANDEIQAIRLLLNSDTYFGAPSPGQLSGLVGLITQGLSPGRGVISKRNMRLLILSAITGIKQLSPLINADASSELLTQHTVQTRIDYFAIPGTWELDLDGKRLIRYLEKIITDQVVELSWALAVDEEDEDDRSRRVVFSNRRRKKEPVEVGADDRSGDDHAIGMETAVPDLQPAGGSAGRARGDPDPWRCTGKST